LLATLGLALLLTAPTVRVGLERVEAEGGKPLRGKRLGLLAHGASVTADGRHAVAVLRGLKLDLRRLFSPEHGLKGMAAAGETVASARDPETRLAVVSLYGERTKPSALDLSGLDTLVVDLQDAGVRFYTYASSMLLCLEAAAETGIEIVILDRPNPLGGELVEGPRAEPASVPTSLLSMAPGPLVHGLTLGEMATLANAGRSRPARLSVVPMQGWRRGMRWRDTGLAWRSPSPNLRSPGAALAYPGTCLLEATNVTEGRGTESPFLLIGAPWLDPGRLRERLDGSPWTEGFGLEPARFTPRSSPAARDPKYADVACGGLRILPDSAAPLRPYRFGLAVIHALRTLHPEFRFLRDGAALDTLLGTRRVREGLERGESPERLVERDVRDLDAWEGERRAFLLY
jgi:uncharacterized protein YbbC (DUF1343 family)